MPVIHADHEEIAQAVLAVDHAAGDAEEEISSCRAGLATLQDSFEGQTAVTFQARYDEWEAAATQLVESLRTLGAWLNERNDIIRQFDEEVSRNISA